MKKSWTNAPLHTMYLLFNTTTLQIFKIMTVKALLRVMLALGTDHLLSPKD